MKIPDVRLLRPRILIIHDNLEKKIFYIVNIFNDEKIKNYNKKYQEINNTINNLIYMSNLKKNEKSYKKINIKIKSNTKKK